MAQSGLSGSWAGARVLVLSPTPTHPQDYGNRKRIFEVCSRFANEGARITFVHYPAEFEWRSALPWSSERAMIKMWPQYYTIGRTRDSHPDTANRYHGIDDWWDPAIGDFLHWLFSVQSFDVFVVNYSWLSKAFDWAPRSVFKILDTHDKVSGRREMLESLGLDAEFFFTTEAEEGIALKRADLVWAIKKEERAQFERMAPVPVLTLPHADPFHAIARPAADPDGYLRVGIIGARNNINYVNITNFLKVAEPIFREAFAPLKIEIAGSVCEMFRELDSPFATLRGRVENVADFYRSVDCVAVPMRVSTGLKIKTGEALSLGVPVVALAHAFEGYEPTDKLHGLAGFAEMAQALVDLSFGSRGRLDTLAGASARSYTRTAAQIASTFEQTAVMARKKQHSMVIAVDSRAFVAGSIFNMVLLSTFEYLRILSDITVLVVRGSAADIVGNEAAIDRFRRVVVGADLAQANELRASLNALRADIFDVEEFLRRVQPRVLLVDALHPAMFGDCCPDASVISRAEMIAMSEQSANFRIPGANYRGALLATPRLSQDVAARLAAMSVEVLTAPCFRHSRDVRIARMADRDELKTVALLGAPRAPAISLAAMYARSWQLSPHIVCSFGDNEEPVGPDGDSVPCHQVDDYLEALIARRIALPHFAVDLSAGKPGLSLCREVLERLHIPTVAVSEIGLHRSLVPSPAPTRAGTESELWTAFRTFALASEAEEAAAYKAIWRELETDRGWSEIWSHCALQFGTNDEALA